MVCISASPSFPPSLSLSLSHTHTPLYLLLSLFVDDIDGICDLSLCLHQGLPCLLLRRLSNKWTTLRLSISNPILDLPERETDGGGENLMVISSSVSVFSNTKIDCRHQRELACTCTCTIHACGTCTCIHTYVRVHKINACCTCTSLA